MKIRVKRWNSWALRKHGVSASAADYLLATVAMESSIPLIHSDADFEAMRPHPTLQTVDWTIHL